MKLNIFINSREIERQNLQTATSNEPTRVHHSKRHGVACCICRRNSQCLRKSSNRPQPDKKQVVSQTNKRKLCELNSFHSNTKRKQEVTSKMAYLKVQNERECVLCGVQFVGNTSRLWWDGVCDICKFQPARTGTKGAISALLLNLLLHSRIV